MEILNYLVQILCTSPTVGGAARRDRGRTCDVTRCFRQLTETRWRHFGAPKGAWNRLRPEQCSAKWAPQGRSSNIAAETLFGPRAGGESSN